MFVDTVFAGLAVVRAVQEMTLVCRTYAAGYNSFDSLFVEEGSYSEERKNRSYHNNFRPMAALGTHYY
jgi:hypothetical protein